MASKGHFCGLDLRTASRSHTLHHKQRIARQRVLSSSEVRASDLEHGGSWVRIPSGAQIFFCVLLWLILYISLYFLYNINISGIENEQITFYTCLSFLC